MVAYSHGTTGQLNNNITESMFAKYKELCFCLPRSMSGFVFGSNLSPYSIFVFEIFNWEKLLQFLCKAQFEAMYILNI